MALGIDRLTRHVQALEQKIDQLAETLARLDTDVYRDLRQALENTEQIITDLAEVRKDTQMAATKADLDAALQTLSTGLQQAGTDVVAAIDRLNAKINSGGQPADLQPEVDSIRTFGQQLSQIDAAAVAAGQTPMPAPTPTPAP